jgi:hypothetical protein
VRAAIAAKTVLQLEAAKAIKDDSVPNPADPWRVVFSVRSLY